MDSQNRFDVFVKDEMFRRMVILRTCIGIPFLIFVGAVIRHLIAPLRVVTSIGISISFFLFVISALVIKRGGRTKVAASFMIAGIFAISINAGLGNGGMMAPVTVGFVLMPIFGAIANGKFGAKLSTVIAIIGIALLYVLEKYQLTLPLTNFEKYTSYKSVIYAFAVGVSYLIAYVYERSRTEVQNELIRQKEVLVHTSKMAALGEMSAGMAHEVNSPLAIIVGKVDSLKRRIDKNEMSVDDLKKDIQKIEEASMRISKIVNGLRSFSRLADADPMVVVSVDQVFHDLSTICAERMKFQQINLQIDFESARGLNILGRQAQIEQVLLNLVNNAYDAIELLDERWVRVHAKLRDDRVLISVMDSGAGIPEKIREKILQPFFTTKEVGRGTGLGLSISKGIIEEHKGELRYDESSPNTCFVIDLPELKV